MTGETVLLAGFQHETNTFAGGTTGRPLFQERHEYFGAEIPEKLGGTNTCEGGAMDAATELDIELDYSVSAAATPSGVVAEDAYEFYSNRILEDLDALEDPVDGVCLCLHGAMVPEGMDDGEGPLVARVREAVGPDVPIAVTLDLHGNNTDQLVEMADILVAFETYPHVDMGKTGERAMDLLAATMRGEISPTMHIERPPVLMTGPKQNTREGPMAEVMAKARDLEARDGVLKVNVFPGFYQADVPSMGFSVPVVTDDDEALATEVARELSTYVWENREQFIGEYPDPTEAVQQAKELAEDLEDGDGPVVMADVGDNPGGGGAADGTTVLRELLDQGVQNAGFAIIRDPESVADCVEAGVGERVTLTLGGKTDDLHGDPIENLDGYVKTLTDGKFRNTGPMGTGSENKLGRGVHLRCGEDDGLSVILTENRMQPLDAEIWRHVGIQPERLDVLVVKSTNHFRADYEPMSSTVIPINSIGLVAMDPQMFEFTNITHPQFPIDETDDDTYPTW